MLLKLWCTVIIEGINTKDFGDIIPYQRQLTRTVAILENQTIFEHFNSKFPTIFIIVLFSSYIMLQRFRSENSISDVFMTVSFFFFLFICNTINVHTYKAVLPISMEMY